MICKLCCSIALAVLSLGGCEVQSASQGHSPVNQSELVIPQGTHVVLFLTGELKGQGKNPRLTRLPGRHGGDNSKEMKPSIIVAQDVVIDGTTVIARGTHVQYMIGGEAPGYMNAPGKIVIEVVGVPSTSLDLVPLSASQSARGQSPSCEDAACEALGLTLFWWVHGDPGKITAGLLFNAFVTEETKLNRSAVPRSAMAEPPPSPGRLHLYQVMQVTSRQPAGNKSGAQGADLSEGPIWSTFYLDGKHLGSLEGPQYACLNVSPGSHTLRVEHREYTFDVVAHQDVYVRVLSQGRDRLVATTEGYQLGPATLTPGRLKRDSTTQCFEFLDEISDM